MSLTCNSRKRGPSTICDLRKGKYTQFELPGKFMKVSYNDSLSD